MGLARKALVALVAVIWLLTPALACLAPLAEMAVDKCCQPQLMSNCGPMQTPSASSCCPVPSGPEQNSLATRTAVQVHHVVVDQAAQLHAGVPDAHAARLLLASGDSPPEPPPVSVSVLRI